MKLMLTSCGITNKSLAETLKKLVNKEEIKIAFIPTAANVEEGEKDWLINDFNNCEKLGTVDIVDISALEKNIWLPRLKLANVIFVGGGNTEHLVKWMKKSGFAEELPELLKTRVYVGISAGSIALSKDLYCVSTTIYEEKEPPYLEGLEYVNFYVLPHLNSPYFPKAREDVIEKIKHNFDLELYALDDDSAIVFNDGKIEVVSEGKWIKYPKVA